MGFTGGFAGQVMLSIPDLPAGVIATYSQNPVMAAGTPTIILMAGSGAALGMTTVHLTGTGGAAGGGRSTSGDTSHSVPVTMMVMPMADPASFTLSAPQSGSVKAGQQISFIIGADPVNGAFSSPVTLSNPGWPPGFSGTFQPSSIAVPGSSVVTVTTTSQATSSDLPILGTAANGANALTFLMMNVMNTTPPSNFTLSAPMTRQIAFGGSTTFTVSAMSNNGFSGNVSVSVTGLTGGLGANVQHPLNVPVNGSDSTSITINALNAAAGTYPLQIVGTPNGGQTQTANITVTVGSGSTGTADFMLSSVAPVTVQTGTAAPPFALGLTPLGNFSGSVTFTYDIGGAQGFAVSFGPNTVSAVPGSTMVLVSAGTAQPGTYTLTITGSGSGRTHMVVVPVKVISGAVPMISLSHPPSQMTPAGNSITFTDTATNPGQSQVTYAFVRPMPRSITANFSPTGVNTATATVNVPAGTPNGTYTLMFSATDVNGDRSNVESFTVTVGAVAGDPADLTAFRTCASAGGTANPCPTLPPGTYTVTTTIVIGRPGVTLRGSTDPDPLNPLKRINTTFLLRGHDLDQPIMLVDATSPAVPITNVAIQNLTFCGAGTGPRGNPSDPCPTGLATVCESGGKACVDFQINNTAAGQMWAAPADAPFNLNNAGPYNVTIAGCDFEDAVPRQPAIYIHPDARKNEAINDIFFSGNTIADGGVQISVGSNINWGDYTQCDKWPGTYADNLDLNHVGLPPRNIRFDGNTFYGSEGVISGLGRYVGFYKNMVIGYSRNFMTGGGAIEQEVCSDKVMITENTLIGNFQQGDTPTSGMELYSRNLTVSKNTVSGFAYEGIGLLSVFEASATGNHVFGNNLAGAPTPEINVATSFPGPGCYPGAPCDAFRDITNLTVRDNDSLDQRGGFHSLGSEYGVLLNDHEGSTNNIGVGPLGVTNNFQSATEMKKVDYKGRVTVNTASVTNTTLISPLAQASTPESSAPSTIAVFPEGNHPLGLSLGTTCNDPPVCTTYSNSGTFQFGATSPGGASNINKIEVFLGTDPGTDPGGPGVNGPYLKTSFCHFIYVPPPQGGTNGIIYLDNNTQFTPSGPDDKYVPDFMSIPSSAIGSGVPLNNSACTLNPASSTYDKYSDNDVILSLDIQFLRNGNYYMYEVVQDRQGLPGQGNQPNTWAHWGYWGPVLQ